MKKILIKSCKKVFEQSDYKNTEVNVAIANYFGVTYYNVSIKMV